MGSTNSLGEAPWKSEASALALGPSSLSIGQTKHCPISLCLLPQCFVIREIKLKCIVCSPNDANSLMHTESMPDPCTWHWWPWFASKMNTCCELFFVEVWLAICLSEPQAPEVPPSGPPLSQFSGATCLQK